MLIEGRGGGRGRAATVNDGPDEDGHGGGTEIWVEDEGEGERGVVKDVGEDMGEYVSGREKEVEADEECKLSIPHLSSSQIYQI